MLKKYISFFLALVFCANFSYVSAADVIENDYEGAVYEEAVETLAGLGIISLFEDGTYRPEQNCSRADCAAIMVRLNGYSDEELRTTGNFPWADVNSDTASAGAILKAYEMGIITGDNNGYYLPEKAVTMQQLEVMLVKILGYGEIAEQYGGFPYGYEKVAADLDLLENVYAKADQPVSRGNVALMIYNALDVNIMRPGFSSNVTMAVQDGRTLLTEYMGIEKGKARITANERTALPGSVKVGSGMVTLGTTKVYKGETNADELLGYEVNYYLNIDDDTLVYVAADRKKNKTVTISANDMHGEVVNDDISKLFGYVESRKKSYKLSPTLYVVYNGCVDNGFTKQSFDIVKGDIKLLDVNNDGEYDIAFINEYFDYVVTTADGYNGILYGMYDKSVTIDEDAVAIFKNAKGEIIDWTALERNRVVSVYASKDGSYIKGYVGEEKSSGSVKSAYNDGEVNVVEFADGNIYKMKDIPDAEFAKLQPGQEILLYLNIYGEVAAFEFDTNDAMRYGYVLRATKSDDDVNGGKLKFIDITGQKYVEAQFDEKIKLNGESRTTAGERYTFDYIYDYVLTSAGKVEPQVIRYKMNDDGKITRIDTAVGSEKLFDEDKLVRAYSGSAHYITSQQTLAGRYKMESSTLKIFLPEKNASGTYDKELISYNMTLWNANSYSVQVYDVDELYVPKLVVFNGVTKTTENTRNVAVISEISTKCDEDGEIYKNLKCFYGGSEVDFRLNDTLNANDLKPGYVVTLVRDAKGVVQSYKKIFDLENELALTTINNAGAADFYSYYYGVAYKKSQSYMTFKYDRLDNMRLAIFGGSANIYRYDSGAESNKRVSKATVADIAEKASKVFVSTNEGVTRDIIIVN